MNKCGQPYIRMFHPCQVTHQSLSANIAFEVPLAFRGGNLALYSQLRNMAFINFKNIRMQG